MLLQRRKLHWRTARPNPGSVTNLTPSFPRKLETRVIWHILQKPLKKVGKNKVLFSVSRTCYKRVLPDRNDWINSYTSETNYNKTYQFDRLIRLINVTMSLSVQWSIIDFILSFFLIICKYLTQMALKCLVKIYC